MGSIQLDMKKTALVVIDMQKGILSLPCAPYQPSDVLVKTVELADAFRANGGFVVLVNVDFHDGGDALSPVTDLPAVTRERPADAAVIAPELGPKAGDLLVTKRQWGAFFGTELDLQLRRRGLDTIVLCGIATDIGVETTAREAYQLGYNQVFVEDAMTALSEEQHTHPLKYLMPRMGRVRSTQEVVAGIQA
ncbi:hydrolase [Alicyclobacillus fastidiosus]|uniref:Hydrolase n=1 Tax=Alicyclobacillus fastidiosus TaxID=392011 RepID=A0ABV5AF01_9BACL|nr:hydrolase [Alicyclobacillus fastidiosus]WEH09447.1 hydrolase [Alicyclobacillus fastidiosus]